MVVKVSQACWLSHAHTFSKLPRYLLLRKQACMHAGDMPLVPCAPDVAFSRPQVLMVSATMPSAARQVAEGWLSPSAAHLHVMHAGSDLVSNTIIQVLPRPLNQHVCVGFPCR